MEMHCLILMNGESMWNTDKAQKFPTIQDIVRAREILYKSIRKTPLLRSNTFSKIIGTNIYLKLESFQTTGSFKVRGAFVKINMLSVEQRKHGVIAASAGNHAQGVAYAASNKNIPCTIVMPQNASPAKIVATKSYGAKVVLSGSDYDECSIAAQEMAKEEGRAIIHAFDDPQVISGQGTIGLELLEDLPDLDQIYIPIGGGGLGSRCCNCNQGKKTQRKDYWCRI